MKHGTGAFLLTILGAGLLVESFVIPLACSAAERVRPNIIFIMADDMGYGDLGCFGGRSIPTPNIDRMAREGTRFTDCYAGSTVCAPSRSVLMTGLHTGHTTVRGNFGVGGVRGLGGGEGRVPLLAEDVTVAEVLRESGYVTGMTGKWGLGEPRTSGQPNRQGFDEWFGYLNQRRAHHYFPEYVWRNESKYPLPENRGSSGPLWTHDLFTGFALDFIRQNRATNFFLYVPYTVPHGQYEIPSVAPFADKPWTRQEKVYAAMIDRLDRDVGRMIGVLKEIGIDQRTVVFFCSDNGAADRYPGTLDSSGPLRGRKRDLFEGGLRSPMIVRWPGHIPADRVDDTPWYFADFLPTAAALAGLEPPQNLDGVNVLPLLMGQTQPELNQRPLYWEFYEKGFQQAARWGKWKAIRPATGARPLLFDLSKDLGETTDLAEFHPEIIERMNLFMDAQHEESPFFPSRRK